MQTKHTDYLSMCNDQKVPEQDFKLAFCNRCSQPECTRSQYGTTLFDQRTQTWVERLFTETPRMNPDDPRFLPIAGREFRTLDLSRVPDIRTPSAWLDPKDIEAPKEELLQATKEELVPIMLAPTPSLVLEPTTKPVQNILLMNAPAQEKMLKGAPSLEGSPQVVTKDRWAAPLPPSREGSETKDGPIVKRGATIKFDR